MLNMPYKRICIFILAVSVILSLSLVPCTAEEDKDDIVIYNNKNNSMKIALTFDDGPHPSQTKRILDILDKYGIKATFFAVGVNIDNYGEHLKDVVSRGHEIGNHTNTHPKVSSLDYNGLKKEFSECQSKINELCGCTPKLLRPPEGLIDTSIKDIAREMNCKVILWDIDTRDWARTSPQKIADHVISKVSAGDIILMHDYIGKNSPTAEALELFIPKLLNMGYKFVVVSELLESE